MVPEGQKPPLQFEELSGDTWTFRFLEGGKYTVLAREHPERGWARADNLAVAAGKVTEVGTLRLSPGGAIQWRITTPPGAAVPGDVVATDSRGIEVLVSQEGSNTIPNLWPGQWTVDLFDRSGEHRLATGQATIVATETVPCDLVVP